MPPIARLARLAASPILRGALLAGVRSPGARRLAVRAARDPRGLARELADPRTLRAVAGSAATQRAAKGLQTFAVAPDELPAALRIARAGMILVPLRWMPAAWLGLWAARRISRRRGPTRGRPPGV